MDTKAFQSLSCGLYILSTAVNGRYAGCVVNTVLQVTASPAQMLVAVNKQNYTARAIQESGMFAAAALAQGVCMDVIRTFGFSSSEQCDKFAQMVYQTDKLGQPYLSQSTCAHFACRVKQQIDVGTHFLFIGEVVQAEVLSNEEPMTYSYYHAVKKGITPPKAPSYVEAEQTRSGWRCRVCGHFHEGDHLEEGFCCPVCGKDATNFERVRV